MTSRRQPRAGTDRWLVSYADFTTLLLAFFMALYAVSDVNPGKLATAASSLREALDTPPIHEGTGVLPGSPVAGGPRSLDPGAPAVRGSGSSDPTNPMAHVREQIEKELAGAITAGQLEIGADDRGLVLSLPESATFPVASADVTATAQAVIDRVAVTLAPLDVGVRIEGHTDDTPIRTARYSSNWELSTARASAVVARFIDQRVDPRRLSAAGYGEFHPRTSNATATGRASNRRVDVVVIETAGD
jgi:chemotaxis protein MotB